MKNQIQIILKDRIKDVQGEKVQKIAQSFLNIDTGKVKTGKIFNVMYDLSETEIERFANLGLRDEIIHDVYINSFYQDTFYKSFVLVAKQPGVTDDEGISAQKTLMDILDLDLDTNTQHIYTEDIYLFENELDEISLKKLSEELLGNKLIQHFEYGKFTGKVEYIPEVQIASDNKQRTINLDVDDATLQKISKDMLLSLNLEEMKAIRAYYSQDKTRAIRIQNDLPEEPTDC